MKPALVDHRYLNPEACLGCGTTSGVQTATATPPKVQAWSCTECGMQWAITGVNPRPAYFEQLAATAELPGAARSVLRQVIALANQVDTLTDRELREQLTALADRAGHRYTALPATRAHDGGEHLTAGSLRTAMRDPPA